MNHKFHNKYQVKEIKRLQYQYNLSYTEVVNQFGMPYIDKSIANATHRREMGIFHNQKTVLSRFKGHKRLKHSPNALNRKRPMRKRDGTEYRVDRID